MTKDIDNSKAFSDALFETNKNIEINSTKKLIIFDEVTKIKIADESEKSKYVEGSDYGCIDFFNNSEKNNNLFNVLVAEFEKGKKIEIVSLVNELSKNMHSQIIKNIGGDPIIEEMKIIKASKEFANYSMAGNDYYKDYYSDELKGKINECSNRFTSFYKFCCRLIDYESKSVTANEVGLQFLDGKRSTTNQGTLLIKYLIQNGYLGDLILILKEKKEQDKQNIATKMSDSGYGSKEELEEYIATFPPINHALSSKCFIPDNEANYQENIVANLESKMKQILTETMIDEPIADEKNITEVIYKKINDSWFKYQLIDYMKASVNKLDELDPKVKFSKDEKVEYEFKSYTEKQVKKLVDTYCEQINIKKKYIEYVGSNLISEEKINDFKSVLEGALLSLKNLLNTGNYKAYEKDEQKKIGEIFSQVGITLDRLREYKNIPKDNSIVRINKNLHLQKEVAKLQTQIKESFFIEPKRTKTNYGFFKELFNNLRFIFNKDRFRMYYKDRYTETVSKKLVDLVKEPNVNQEKPKVDKEELKIGEKSKKPKTPKKT